MNGKYRCDIAGALLPRPPPTICPPAAESSHKGFSRTCFQGSTLSAPSLVFIHLSQLVSDLCFLFHKLAYFGWGHSSCLESLRGKSELMTSSPMAPSIPWPQFYLPAMAMVRHIFWPHDPQAVFFTICPPHTHTKFWGWSISPSAKLCENMKVSLTD